MQTMTRESWTDERLDEFGKRMERTIVFGVIALSSAYIAGFAALVTQL